MFTHDPRSAKVSKGFESPNLQGSVNSPRSSIFAGVTKIVLLGLEGLYHLLLASSVHAWDAIFDKGVFGVVSEQDELPSSIGLDFRARLDGGRIVEVTKLTTGRLVNGSSCDWIDMVIKNLDLKPKDYAMMRDFLE
ncbi:hypothetical protein Tco_0615532 [Tanacetum coccineum]